MRRSHGLIATSYSQTLREQNPHQSTRYQNEHEQRWLELVYEVWWLTLTTILKTRQARQSTNSFHRCSHVCKRSLKRMGYTYGLWLTHPRLHVPTWTCLALTVWQSQAQWLGGQRQTAVSPFIELNRMTWRQRFGSVVTGGLELKAKPLLDITRQPELTLKKQMRSNLLLCFMFLLCTAERLNDLHANRRSYSL